VFLEPLGHNPLINLYRRLTPSMRTTDEHPLRMRDIARMRDSFGHVEVEFFGLLAPLTAFLGRSRPARAVASRLQRVDRWLLARPTLQRFAWMGVITARSPSRREVPR
jgi:hypothetical protein